MISTRGSMDMQTKLTLITEIAGRDKKARIQNLACLLNVANLKECYYKLKKNKASGVDGVSLEEYGENLDENLHELVDRMKRQAYKPQPVKRVYIPKANGKMRPLGIPSVEDKIIQMGLSMMLNAIYEVDFLDFSYGFRPGRDCHQALSELNKIIMTRPVNHIIDADIKGFFDNVSHEWLKKFLLHRTDDFNFLRLISRFLINGYMEEGKLYKTNKGTPQGGVVSPILANVYLHYVLDLWIEKKVKPNFRGYVGIVRYADDFVICCQYKDESEILLEMLKERLGKFNLELAEDKTRIIDFGRQAKQNAESKGTRPSTFDFLGFTHFIDKTRTGNFKLGRKTSGKKMSMKLKEMSLWLKQIRNLLPLKEWWRTLKAKLLGHYRYYGVSGNYRNISNYYYYTVKLVYKWINRRSQKRSFNWETFTRYLQIFELPKPKIYHNFYIDYAKQGEYY